LKTLSGHSIRPVVALEEDIKKLQDRVFGDRRGGLRAHRGMVRMRADGLTKAARGVTSIEEMLRTTV
jgi:type II secretory ATPase GspE/PulE/Tfp pilus assembly ATPase PilB-like protein